jgi:hypothetical protein
MTTVQQTQAASVAAEYEFRLTRLLEDGFGAKSGDLLARGDKAAASLPADLARQLRDLVRAIAYLKSGGTFVDQSIFRASAEAIMASLSAPSVRQRAERGGWRKRIAYPILGLLLLSPVIIIFSIYSCIMAESCKDSRETLHLLLVLSFYFVWPSFLYWVLDRAIKKAIPISRTRTIALGVLLVLFCWALGAWLIALFNADRENPPGPGLSKYFSLNGNVDDDYFEDIRANPANKLLLGNINHNNYDDWDN